MVRLCDLCGRALRKGHGFVTVDGLVHGVCPYAGLPPKVRHHREGEAPPLLNPPGYEVKTDNEGTRRYSGGNAPV